MARKRRPEDRGAGTDAQVAAVAETTPSGSGVGSSEQGSVALAAERIRQRAHEFYEQRIAKGLPGDAEGDWLRAEAELAPRAKPRSRDRARTRHRP